MKSRKGVELILRHASDRLPPELADRIAPYRAGYTPAQRHEIERRLVNGELLGVVATDALELGIDIGELDAAICVTFPGPWPACARCGAGPGRRGRGLAVYVAGEDALDQFFCPPPAGVPAPSRGGRDHRSSQPGDPRRTPALRRARGTAHRRRRVNCSVTTWRDRAEHADRTGPTQRAGQRVRPRPRRRLSRRPRGAALGLARQLRADRRQQRRSARNDRGQPGLRHRSRGRDLPSHGALLPGAAARPERPSRACSSRSAATTSRRPSARA